MDLRSVMRAYPTGVTIVTAANGGTKYGGTMNSFTSVSLDPPLIGLFIGTKSRTAQAILDSRHFAVNILKADQGELATKFAQDNNDEKFNGIETFEGENEVPILKDSLGHIECELYLSQEIADHVLVVGKVTGASLNDEDGALLYYNRKFHNIHQ